MEYDPTATDGQPDEFEAPPEEYIPQPELRDSQSPAITERPPDLIEDAEGEFPEDQSTDDGAADEDDDDTDEGDDD